MTKPSAGATAMLHRVRPQILPAPFELLNRRAEHQCANRMLNFIPETPPMIRRSSRSVLAKS